MKKLYFVRHGQTVWNEEDRICGETDSPLTEKGHRQAVELAEKIKSRLEEGLSIDEMLYSPLSRAKDTAQHIHELTGIPMRSEKRLLEQRFGFFEGTTRFGKEFQESKQHFADDYRGGESMLKLAQRVYNLLDELSEDEKVYLLVAHNGIARMTNSYFHSLTNEQYATYRMGNCEIAEYVYGE